MKKQLKIFTILLFSVTFGVTYAQIPDGNAAPDFTATDIEGNSHSLYADYLNMGKAVIIDISATWCGPCWAYHQSHALKNLYNAYGPNGSNEIAVLFIEGASNTNLEDLQGTGPNTLGDWITGTPYPIIDNASLSTLFEIDGYPTIYGICPDGTSYEFGQKTTNQIVSLFASKCGLNINGATDNGSLIGSQMSICENESEIVPKVEISNLGTNNLTSLALELSQGGNVIDNVNWQGNLTPFSSEVVSFSTQEVNSNVTFSVSCSMPNGNDDMYNYNNHGEIDIELAPSVTENTIKVIIATDHYPGETSWNLKDGNGNTLESFGPYQPGPEQYNGGGPDANQTFEYTILLPAGEDCYELNIFDSWGDGMANTQQSQAGYAIVTLNGQNIISELEKPKFGSEVKELFSAVSDGLGDTTRIDEYQNVISLSLYPNPVNSVGELRFDLTQASTVGLEVVDLLGKVMLSKNESLTAGQQNIHFDVADLPNGVYLAKLSVNGEMNVEKFTILK